MITSKKHDREQEFLKAVTRDNIDMYSHEPVALSQPKCMPHGPCLPFGALDKKQQFQDQNKRIYVVEKRACYAGIGTVKQDIHILYENGEQAVISEKEHQSHSLLEQEAQSQHSYTPEWTPEPIQDRDEAAMAVLLDE